MQQPLVRDEEEKDRFGEDLNGKRIWKRRCPSGSLPDVEGAVHNAAGRAVAAVMLPQLLL